jgi:kynurenine formamidase
MDLPEESEVLSWVNSLSNWGRWGDDDQLGTLNLITPNVRRRAAAAVREGISVSCAWDVPNGPVGVEGVVTAVPSLPGTKLGYSTEKITALTVHGFASTHLDALCHIFWEGQMYNGLSSGRVSADGGATQLPITVARGGVITRGVLLDVAAARKVPWLEPGEGVFPDDLEAAESRQGVRVESGDAVLLRTGFGRYRRGTGWLPGGAESAASQPGWHAASLPWLREREVSLIGCDTANDVTPSGYPAIPLPVHVVALVAMGLWLMDNCDLEDLSATATRLSRWNFHLSVCPLTLAGLTSSLVNPIATF